MLRPPARSANHGQARLAVRNSAGNGELLDWYQRQPCARFVIR